MYKIGVSKVEMTFFTEGCGMLGYGMHFHNMEGVETPQYARAFAIQKGKKKVVIVNTDICFSTIMLKQHIVDRLAVEHPSLGYKEENIMILAQHTHSTAGGYTQHLAYNFSMPGFRQDVFDTYSNAILEAILKADADLKEGTIRHHKGDFDEEAPVCFNRSFRAYNKNPEVEERIKRKKRHLACDRTMKLLRFDDAEGQPIGTLNWFGVHTTSVSNRYRKVCYDNKGYAAEYFEAYLKEQYPEQSDVIASFAQDSAGDISPNYKWSRKDREYKGKFDDDYESAAYNGELQFEQAKAIFEGIEEGKAIEGDIDYIMMYVDMSNVQIDESYTDGLKHEITSQPAWGMSFLEGTTDGQGANRVVGQAIRLILRSFKQMDIMAARLSKDPNRQQEVIDYYRAHHPKHIIINHETGVVAGAQNPEKLVVPAFVDPAVKYIKFANKVGYGKKTPWIPCKLPLQIMIIGSLAIVGIPAEITTIAGQRVRETVAKVLQERGVTEVQIAPYANSYAGYITTYEEYRVQMYEGGHTLFGKWTLAAYQMKFKQLATELLKDPEDRQAFTLRPDMFSMDEIWTGMDDFGVLEALKETEEAFNNKIMAEGEDDDEPDDDD